MGHAGSDVEIAYRSPSRDPGRLRARPAARHRPRSWSKAGHWSAGRVLARYEQVRQRVGVLAVEVGAEPRLASRRRGDGPLSRSAPRRRRGRSARFRPTRRPLTLAQAINRTLGDELADHDDVARLRRGRRGQGRGVRRHARAAGPVRVGPRLRHPARRADHPRHGAGHQPRGVRAGARDPVPRLPAQRRGPAARRGGLAAASSPTASTATAWSCGSRAWPTRRASAATSTTTTRWPCCATSRGSPWPCQPPAQRARTAARLPRPGPAGSGLRVRRADRQVPHPRPVRRRRGLARAVRRRSTRAALGDVVGVRHRAGPAHRDVRQRGLHEPPGGRDAASGRLRLHGPRPRVGGAAPGRALVGGGLSCAAVLVVDETRHSGGVSEAVVAALVDAGYQAPISRVTSADSFIPLGPAADAVLLSEEEILAEPQRPGGRPPEVRRAPQTVKSTPCASGSSPEKLTVFVARRM